MEQLDFNRLRTAHAAQKIQTTMMDIPLRITDLIKRAETYFPHRKVVTRRGPHQHETMTYADLGLMSRKMANGLKQINVQSGTRIATLMWTHAEHLALYYAAPVVEAIVHPLNLRLTPEELAYIIADAGDDVIIVDEELVPLLEKVLEFVDIPTIIINGQHPDYALTLNDLLNVEPIAHWPEGPYDENTPIGISYTSGTTGRPKGVVYSHRSTVLHAVVCALHSGFCYNSNETLLNLTQLFHVHAWGVPYSATMMGLNLILPGARIGMDEVLDMTVQYKVTQLFGVPTIWTELLKLLDQQPDRWKFETPLVLHSGGSSATDEMYHRFNALGMTLQNGWGMTECSPIATQTWLQSEHEQLSEQERFELTTSNGLPLPLIDMRIADENNVAQPWDGQSTGELQVRSPWITQDYLSWEKPISASTTDGWLKTGDVAMVRPNGYMNIVDRMKDLIKSGGEWISSVDMENHLCSHPSVIEAAVVSIPDEKWGERPLAIVVLRQDPASIEQIKQYLSEFYEKWMLPEAIVPMDEIPKTSIGKIDKKLMREHYQRYLNQSEQKRLA